MRALLVMLIAAGCAHEGQPIADWTFDVDGGPSGIRVTLPNTLVNELPARELDFTMRADVPLAANMRGKDLTLAFDCFHGSLALTVDGRPVSDIGDVAVGEHRYIIAAASTDRAQLAITARAHRDTNTTGWGFSVEPHLIDGIRTERSAAASWNRAAATTFTALVSVMALLFGMLYVLDHRRRANAAFALGAVAVIPLGTWELGLTPGWLDAMGVAIGVICNLYFLHWEFDLQTPPPRSLLVLFALIVVACPFAVLSFAFARGVLLAFTIASFLFFAYFIQRLRRLSRQRHADARIILAAGLIGMPGYIPILMQSGTGWTVPLAGRHIEVVAHNIWLLGIAVVLARQHVARHRSLEVATAELQRQVAERSRDLAAALSKLARTTPTSIAAERVIDGRYRVVRRLGIGGMGAVFEVERIADRKRLALKTLRGQPAPEAIARFAREANVAAELDHPNLVPVLDLGIADEGLFIVMPLVEAGSLEHQRSRFGDTSWARPYLAQIAAGLAVLHERAIVHRDLKPANVLLDAGVARIADFGLATVRGDPGNRTMPSVKPDIAFDETLAQAGLTRAGDVFGTPSYMAPELSGGVRDYAPSADVFAFGLIAYELLRGRAAFEIPPFVAMQRGQTVAVPDLRDVDPLVARCLALDPAHRPTAQELATAFRL